MSDLLLGNILVKKGEKGKYYKVATPDGREGFVLKKHAAALEEWANQTYDFKTIEKMRVNDGTSIPLGRNVGKDG